MIGPGLKTLNTGSCNDIFVGILLCLMLTKLPRKESDVNYEDLTWILKVGLETVQAN